MYIIHFCIWKIGKIVKILREIEKNCENWQYAVCMYGREEHDRCYFHGPSATREIRGEKWRPVNGFCWFRESIWYGVTEGDLVDPEIPGCRWMDSVSDEGYVWGFIDKVEDEWDRESRAFNVKVGVHQGSVLSPLLFIILQEVLYR